MSILDRRVRLGIHGWYVDGEQVTEQQAARILDHQQEVQQNRTE